MQKLQAKGAGRGGNSSGIGCFLIYNIYSINSKTNILYALAKHFILFCGALFVCSINFSFGQIQTIFQGLTVPVLALHILEKLSSTTTRMALESELVDLCGYDWLDEITSMILHRDQLKSSFLVIV